MAQINIELNDNLVRFENLKVGEVFSIEDDLYIKILTEANKSETAAVCLVNSCCYPFYSDEIVHPVKTAKLEVEK